jgi:hypothetical protein
MILFVTLKEHILIFFIKVFFLYHSPRRCHTALANKQKAVGRQRNLGLPVSMLDLQ